MKKAIILSIIIFTFTGCKNLFILDIKLENIENVQKKLQYSDKYINYKYKTHPILITIKNNSTDMLNLLLSKGFDIDSFNKLELNGKEIRSYFEYSLHVKSYDTASLLIKSNNLTEFDLNLIYKEVFINKNEAIIKAVLSKPDFLNMRYKDIANKNLIPLPSWLLQNNLELYIVDYIKNNEDLNITDSNGEGLIHYGLKFSSLRFLRKLLEAGYSPNNENNRGYTPIYSTIKEKDFNKLKLLVDFGADLAHTNDIEKNSAFHFLISHFDYFKEPDKSRLKALIKETNFNLDYVANCIREDLLGTPLMHASLNFNIELVDLILLKNVDTTTIFPYKFEDAPYYFPNYYNKDVIDILYDLGQNWEGLYNKQEIDTINAIKHRILNYNKSLSNSNEIGLFKTNSNNLNLRKYFKSFAFHIIKKDDNYNIDIYHLSGDKFYYLDSIEANEVNNIIEANINLTNIVTEYDYNNLRLFFQLEYDKTLNNYICKIFYTLFRERVDIYDGILYKTFESLNKRKLEWNDLYNTQFHVKFYERNYLIKFNENNYPEFYNFDNKAFNIEPNVKTYGNTIKMKTIHERYKITNYLFNFGEVVLAYRFDHSKIDGEHFVSKFDYVDN